jgi:hypothetical protein
MGILNKNKKVVEVEITEVMQNIIDLAADMEANRVRTEKQKAEIPGRIDVLRKELDMPQQIPVKTFNSFEENDVFENSTPRENKSVIAKKITSLMAVMELPIQSDKGYMNSIHRYLEAIRPVVIELEAKQWENLKLIEAREQELEAMKQEILTPVWGEYFEQQTEIKRLMNTAYNGMGNVTKSYNKQCYRWSDINNAPYKIEPLVSIIDRVLEANEGSEVERALKIH